MQKDERYKPLIGVKGAYWLDRYQLDWGGTWICYDMNEARKFVTDPVELRKVQLSTFITAADCPYNLYFVLALVNSKLLSYYHLSLALKGPDLHPQVLVTNIPKLPERRINFTTPEKERKQLLEKGKELYQEYLVSHDWSKVLAFVAECLPQKADGTPDMEQEKSDVAHDLLAFLAEEMTQLNKEKQSKIKGFLAWLEKEILKGSVEDQKNKTRIKDFHNDTFEDLLDVLKKNRAVEDPCPSKVRDIIAGEFSAAVNALNPLKVRIKATDDLIDQIVYRLYGLTDAEIAVVAGQQSHVGAA